MKHLLKLLDLSGEQITELLNLGDQLKYEQKHGIDHQRLKGQTLGMIFQKSSTRTRVSFEVGIHQLGGTGLFLSANDLQIGRGEPVQDTARILSHIRAAGGRGSRKIRFHSGHQRPDRFLPSLPGARRPDDGARA